MAAHSFAIDFDFIDHVLAIQTGTGHGARLPLRPIAVADFYAEVMAALGELGLAVGIRTMPCEIVDASPSTGTARTRLTTATMPTGSGGCWPVRTR